MSCSGDDDRPRLHCAHHLPAEEDSALLSPPLALGQAFFVQEWIAAAADGRHRLWQQWWNRDRVQPTQRELDKALARLAEWGPERAGGQLPAADPGLPMTALLPALLLQQLHSMLAGRALLGPEAARQLTETLPPVRSAPLLAELPRMLLELARRGQLELQPGVRLDRGGWASCARCGQAGRVRSRPCRYCRRKHCLVCEECAILGESRQCLPFVTVPPGRRLELKAGAAGSEAAVRIELDFELTPVQHQAAAAVQTMVETRQSEQGLIWAVCGAGKTEVVFPAVAAVLRRGGNVLLAIPRREVVQELEGRVRKAFPEVRIAALYGGSPGKYRPAELVISTTHQALRLYRNFALTVLDEADAYPYRDSAMLHYAVQRACEEGGITLYLTATPGRELIEAAEQGKLWHTRISARHHGFPLPEPEFLEEPQLVLPREERELGRPAGWPIPAAVAAAVRSSLESGAQLLVFVPTVRLVELVGRGLLPTAAAAGVDWVHAGDPDREQKQRYFREGRIRVLVSTTILERGVTIPRLHVLVLFADWEVVFDEGTLVQMAGRSGRTVTDPVGRVVFAARRTSPEMRRAQTHIRKMNEEARCGGHLREGRKLP